MANIPYANARACALENTLLRADRINRMIDCKDADDAIKVLLEVNFGDGVALSSAMDFENLLFKESEKLFDFIKETCPSKALAEFLMAKNDFHNAEAFIKNKHLKIDVDDMLVGSGNFDCDDLKEKIMLDDYSALPTPLANALMQSDLDFVNGKATGISVSSLFAKAYYQYLSELAKGNKYLTEIFSVKADLTNVSVALRTRNFILAKEMFVPLGKISLEQLKSLSEDSFDLLKETFRFSYLAEIILKGIEEKENGKPLSDFERLADGYAVKLLQKNKYDTAGLLPFIRYCYYKIADIENVRIVIVGLNNNQSKKYIKGRLRAYYE